MQLKYKDVAIYNATEISQLSISRLKKRTNILPVRKYIPSLRETCKMKQKVAMRDSSCMVCTCFSRPLASQFKQPSSNSKSNGSQNSPSSVPPHTWGDHYFLEFIVTSRHPCDISIERSSSIPGFKSILPSSSYILKTATKNNNDKVLGWG